MARKKKQKFSFKIETKHYFYAAYAVIGLVSCVVLFIGAAYLIPYDPKTDGLYTLDDVQDFVARKEEFPDMDGKDIIKPNYQSFIKKDVSSDFGRRIRNLFDLMYLPMGANITADYFEQQLDRLVKAREERGYKKGYLVQKHLTNPDSTFVVFGDLQGALHSLSRGLTKLAELEMINDDLVLSDNTVLIFLGDVVGRSPYIMATMSVIMRLMEQNPDRVIYIRGSLEDQLWKYFGFPRELVLRGRHLSKDKIPLEKQLNRFFDTLPRAFYAMISSFTAFELVRFSYFSRRKRKLINEDKFGKFLFVRPEQTLETYNVKTAKRSISLMRTYLKAIVRSQKKRTKYKLLEGVRFLPHEFGAKAWSVLSCPTRPYIRALNFYTDTFAVIKAGKKIEDWTLTHYYRDVRKDDDFDSKEYNFMSGKEIVPPEDEKQKEYLGAISADDVRLVDPDEEDDDEDDIKIDDDEDEQEAKEEEPEDVLEKDTEEEDVEEEELEEFLDEDVTAEEQAEYEKEFAAEFESYEQEEDDDEDDEEPSKEPKLSIEDEDDDFEIDDEED